MIPRKLVIRGAGDLATGVAHRLVKAGFSVIMLEQPEPLVVRRGAAFATAVYKGKTTVEEIEAELCTDPEMIEELINKNIIPLFIDPQALLLTAIKPQIVIDATMRKENISINIDEFKMVIGLGPGFIAGFNAHAVIETMRGPDLGRVIYKGTAAKDTGIPASVGGYGKERLLKAPETGIFKPVREIGDLVSKGETIAYIGSTPVLAEIDGLVRGLLYPETSVTRGTKIGDIDPRGKAVNHFLISDKARSIGGAVLEAILHRFFFRH